MLDKKEKKKKVKVYRSHLHGPCFADHKRNVLFFFFFLAGQKRCHCYALLFFFCYLTCFFFFLYIDDSQTLGKTRRN